MDMFHIMFVYWGEPKRAPHLRVGRLPAYASGCGHIYMYIYIYIYIIYMYLFRPTILQTFSTSDAHVRLFQGPKRFLRRRVRPEEDVDTLFETSDANFRSRRRLFRLSARPL